MEYEIVLSTEADNEDIHQQLRKYNRRYMSHFHDYSFHISENGKIIAGIVAGSTFDTLEVEFLFVDDEHRKSGIGTALLKKAEQAAAADGIKHVLLNTYSFQAPEFYKKQGYKQLFEIAPCLGEYSQFFFWKEL